MTSPIVLYHVQYVLVFFELDDIWLVPTRHAPLAWDRKGIGSDRLRHCIVMLNIHCKICLLCQQRDLPSIVMGFDDCSDGQQNHVNLHAQDEASSAPRLPLNGMPSNPLHLTASPKALQILQACTDSADTHKLATLATSKSGLVDDEVRRLACKM